MCIVTVWLYSVCLQAVNVAFQIPLISIENLAYHSLLLKFAP